MSKKTDLSLGGCNAAIMLFGKGLFLAMLILCSASGRVRAVPTVTSADYHVVPQGDTIALTGHGLASSTSARFIWMPVSNTAEIGVPTDTSLTVVMPSACEDYRDYLLLVEGTDGATLGLPSDCIFHTGTGPVSDPHTMRPVIVESGAVLTGGLHAQAIYVHAGGVYEPFDAVRGNIYAADGAVIDFSMADASQGIQCFFSPDTVVIGSAPAPASVVLVPSLSLSTNVGFFAVGYPLGLSVEGPGVVAVSPERECYGLDESVSLTAIPTNGAHFIRWLGTLPGREPAITVSIEPDIAQVARFSTEPDYYRTWRPACFSPEELGQEHIAGLDADPDRDGLSNAAEYAFGTNPRNPDNEYRPRGRAVSVNSERQNWLSYVRPRDALDVEYKVLVSQDLQNWHFNGDGSGLTYSEFVSALPLDDDLEEVSLVLYPDSNAPRMVFVRISASLFE